MSSPFRNASQTSRAGCRKQLDVSLLTVACIVGGLTLLDVIPEQRFQNLPPWLQVVLFICVVISGVAVVCGFIADYRQIRRARQTEDG